MRKTVLTIVPILALLIWASGCDQSPETPAAPGQGQGHGHDHSDGDHAHPHTDEGDTDKAGHGHDHDGDDHAHPHANEGQTSAQEPAGGHGHAHASGGHGGQAHGDEGPEPVSVTLFASKVLLFMEYPQLVRGEPAEFLAHFTVLETGDPVRAGTLALEFTGPNGKTETVEANAPARPGIFIPEHAFGTAGTYRGRLVLKSPQVQDTLDLGELTVHSGQEAALVAAERSQEGEPADAVPFLMEQQWKVGTLLARVERRTLTKRLQLPGEIKPPQDGAAVVGAPVSGRLLPGPSGKLPEIGDRVEAGQVLARIEPPLPATEAAALSANRAQLQALETELVLRSLDLGMKGLEVERAFKQAKARLPFVKRAFARAKEIKAKGVGSDQQCDKAQQDVELAQAEYDAARAMKQFYEESSAKLAEMQGRLKSRGVRSDDSLTTMQLPLKAPISGHIVERAFVEGEHVEALEAIYEIVNLERVWIVARISEFDLGRLPDTPNAGLELPAFPGRPFDVRDTGGRLVNIGTRVDKQTRTVPIRFEMPNPEGVFRAGMFANVHLETRRAVDCLTLPEKAIVLNNGRPQVYVMLEGETFQRRDVELGIRDNGWVQVKAGIQEGERVSTKGAYAIKLAALSPASFGHGHGH